MAIDAWADSVQTAAVVLGVGGALLAWRQVRIGRHGGGGANVLALWSILQSQEARDNRRALYTTFERVGPFVAGPDRDHHNWDGHDVEAALHCCQVWSVAGAVAKRDLVPVELVVDEWGFTIARIWRLVEPLVTFERNRQQDPDHWASFQWLALETAQRRPNL